MKWVNFEWYALISVILWIAGVLFTYINKKKSNLSSVIYSMGVLTLGIFLLMLWNTLDRPPMRTLGETRLWYSFFLPVIGLATYRRWQYNWILAYSTLMAIVFLGINLMNPETHSKTLMPALQSPWFVPHVIVYIFSYAILAASSLVAVKGIYQSYTGKFELKTLHMADNLVYIGFGFLTLGLLFGALWAKEAWGHYWTWDPKETWAFITWIAYLIYIHFRVHHPKKEKAALWSLGIAFILLLICWFGINYLPAAQSSVHTYSS
ncbi:cytochrome c biogenesis protein CcsA [Xanthovirga aplysinae]|uniref:cytochrome c biogenesis protein CcsA n=1 Tax=Xanthovirga aplysinae TaxID=2529853 RepID=UPI0012BC08A5|nr:cytochrome c biogenesis protein CcsA [Xanthovirga aplysinae]MTI32466.1 cytochrome C assembly protein [Xanthovirga aplysinae]